MQFLKPLALLATSIFLAGCSSGGGGSTSAPNIFETAEYQSQGGLDLINASAMYLMGGTGSGVNVAVFDTGGTFSHPDLAGNYSASRYTLYASLDDVDGHGTLVAGIIAAAKNDTGMHGVAYNANIVSYKVLDNNGVATALTDTAWATAINTMASTNVLITNNSYGSSISVTALIPSDFTAINPLALAAFRAYDAAGGVQVWAVGNESSNQPNVEAGLPFLFPDLQSSWIAVMAVNLNGSEPGYTNRCGVAAAWCLAAPGTSIFSTSNTGGYANATGTSFAAPHVTGAIAALKSVFPNLSFQQIRDRVLVTANKSGAYSNTAIYGQGLLDLDRASRPVGGLSLALSGNASGPAASANGAAIKLPAGALAGYAGSTGILVFDNYQRAPFLVPLSTFSQTRQSYLSLYDLGLQAGGLEVTQGDDGVSLALRGVGYRVGAQSGRNYIAGVGQGTEVMKGFAQLAGQPMPYSKYRMHPSTTGAVLGLRYNGGTLFASAASGTGDISDATAGTGIESWAPGSVVALSFVPDSAQRAFGLSIASDLQKPMGWSGTGAFSVTGDSINLGYSQSLLRGDRFNIGFASQLAYVTADQNPLVYLGDAVVASAELGLTAKLSGSTTLTASFGMEHPLLAGDGYVRAASSVDSSGQISYQNVAVDQSDLLQFSKAMVGVRHRFTDSISLSAGAAFVRDGFGEMDSIVGLGAAIRF